MLLLGCAEPCVYLFALLLSLHFYLLIDLGRLRLLRLLLAQLVWHIQPRSWRPIRLHINLQLLIVLYRWLFLDCVVDLNGIFSLRFSCRVVQLAPLDIYRYDADNSLATAVIQRVE